ncbi:MAG TPA: hypothetical protein VFV64_12410 [Permianibacter sp.]|nr:hypothetical protein [Permianibacter sp.]
MNSKALVMFALGLSASAVSAAESRFVVYEQNGFSAEATINECDAGCARQMAVTVRHDFIYNGDYQALLGMLESFGLRVSVYDGEWADADEGEVVMKVSSTIHQRQRWRRANLRRKMDAPVQMASAIHASVPAGTLVTLEYQQAPIALSGNDFTINVRRYNGETIVSSGSRAVAPVGGSNDDTLLQ